MSVVTVKNQIGYLRRFLEWLHRSRDFDWRDTDRIIEDALGRRRYSVIQTPEERKRSAQGPDSWTVPELKKLYQAATDRERVYMLLGLNGAFAQSEIMHLLLDEVKVDDDPPIVHMLRNKTKKWAAFSLWPETVEALDWINQRCCSKAKKSTPWAVLNDAGNKLNRQRISNAWTRVLKRVQRHDPDFRDLSFKFLRKTNAALLSQCGAEAEVIAIVHGRAKRTPHDDEADAYYPRLIERVHKPLMDVRKRLRPMLDSVDDAFSDRRRTPIPLKYSPDMIKTMRRMRREGRRVIDIAAELGCGPATVSQYTKERATAIGQPQRQPAGGSQRRSRSKPKRTASATG